MDEFLLSDTDFEEFFQFLDCDFDTFCEPPPMFDLPPPPLPPWLDTLPDCSNNCDNMPEVTSLNSVQDIFQVVTIIIVSSVILVLVVLLLAVLVWRRWQYLIKNVGSQELSSEDTNRQLGKENQLVKECDIIHKSKQNYYISDQKFMRTQNGHTLLASTHSNQLPTLLIGGVPFHIVRQLNSSSDSSNLSDQNPPIYETIESDYYSEMSSVGSDRGEVGSTTYQEFESQFGTPIQPVTNSQFINRNSVQFLQPKASQSIPTGNRFQTFQSRSKYNRQAERPNLRFSSHYQSGRDHSYSDPTDHYNKDIQDPRTESKVILQSIQKNSPVTQL
eukprot:TRINITY_DN34290_c0_g1_i1.p1 TRINITY_DN34290_c0_g1~~TRINITY_DN34290_c0_g1_i1.p1  ORF type:complete len:339 (-),score=38.93 TRINITY_DN34290_c0_g1_i1:224-1216(-)